MSKRRLKDATYSAVKLLKNTRSLAYNTRSDYIKIAILCLTELYQMQVQLPDIRSLKQKHVTKLLEEWKSNKLSNATIKNRLSVIRTIGNMLGKKRLIPDNKTLNVGSRIKNKSNLAVNQIDLNKITNPFIAYSLRLQQAFGLRRQESIKFIVSQADKETYLDIKGSWTKGGIPRKIPVTNQMQRDLLNELHCFCFRGKPLIPADKNYQQQLNTYISQTRRASMRNLHGLRHAYAQRRYRELTTELTGKKLEPPICGGKSNRELTQTERTIDKNVRKIISSELGHQRIRITEEYLGK